MRVPQTTPVMDCTAACYDLSSCDLAWWFEGHCYLLSCPHKENCKPKKMGLIRSCLTFVLRPTQRPTQLLDYGEMMLNRGLPLGLSGDSPEEIRRDLPFLGKDQGEMPDYSDDYRELEQDLFQPISKQEPRGSAEDWGLLPGRQGGLNSSVRESSATSAEKQRDPELHNLVKLNELAGTPAPEPSPERRLLLPLVTTPSSGEVLEKEEAFSALEQTSNSSGKEVLMPSHNPPPSSLEFSPATMEENPVPTITSNTDHSLTTLPTSTVYSQPTPSEQPESPTTDSWTVKELMVSAGDNLIITLPKNEVELKAFVVPAPFAETIYSYNWSLISHPVDYGDEMEQKMQALNLSRVKNNTPVAVAGPDKELIFPLESTTLDGSRSTDGHNIVSYHWDTIRGPSAVQMEDIDKAIASVTGLHVDTYDFRLTVQDQQGLSSTGTLTAAVKKENSSPPTAQAGGRHILVLPNNSITLDGSRSNDDQGIVSYLWTWVSQSPAAGDVIDGSDRSTALQLTNLVERVYTFHLKVTDGQGNSDTDTATVEVQPDLRKSGLVELSLQVEVGQLTEQQTDMLVRQLAVLLNVLDSDIKVQRIQLAMIVFYVQSGKPFKVINAAEVAQNLHVQLSKEKANFLLFKVFRIGTAGCLLKCSGQGHCDPITKRCVCSQLWMENLIQCYIRDWESNCEWSIFYVAMLAFTLTVLTGGLTLCICCCKRQKRTKIRKKPKCTVLDNMDEQEKMELRPKLGIKHRSTEHNSSLMVSESEFDSDQDTIFSQEQIERGNPKVSMNDSIPNGASFSYCAKDRQWS
ncbi:LOW QUALITY PROTEIN: dyslexia-associated protein KIAA0319 homolog [Dugong dugon]